MPTPAPLAYSIRRSPRPQRCLSAVIAAEIHPANMINFVTDVDLSSVEAVRAEYARSDLPKPSYTSFVVKAVALSLRKFPYANARLYSRPFSGFRIQQFHVIDAAVAVERDIPEAPMVAFIDVIRDADRLTLPSIHERLRAFSQANISNNPQWAQFSRLLNKVPPFIASWLLRMPAWSPRLWSKYRGGAFVVSSPAKYGVGTITGAWHYPLGVSFGLVEMRARVKGNKITATPCFNLTLSWDRRLMAGAQAARFFNSIVDELSDAAPLHGISGNTSPLISVPQKR